MLTGIDPVLSGELLLHLDAMGHSDTVVIADAHFPAARLGERVVRRRHRLRPGGSHRTRHRLIGRSRIRRSGGLRGCEPI